MNNARVLQAHKLLKYKVIKKNMSINIYKHYTMIRWIIIPLHLPFPLPVRLYNMLIIFIVMYFCYRQFRQDRFSVRVRIRSFYTTGYLQSTAQIMVQFCRGKHETGSSANVLELKTTIAHGRRLIKFSFGSRTSYSTSSTLAIRTTCSKTE